MTTGKTQTQQALKIKILKNRADFVTLNRKAKKWVSHGLVLQALPNEFGDMRVGFTITKKTEKSSVRRNRVKRRLRAAAMEVLPLHARSSHDYVLIGKTLTATRPFESLCADLKWCLEKLSCNNE